jgi:hypothetical protein
MNELGGIGWVRGLDKNLEEMGKREEKENNLQTHISRFEAVTKLFLRPFGAGPFSTYTQGLSPGLHFFAAARLLLVRFTPSARVNFEFRNSLGF